MHTIYIFTFLQENILKQKLANNKSRRERDSIK